MIATMINCVRIMMHRRPRLPATNDVQVTG